MRSALPACVAVMAWSVAARAEPVPQVDWTPQARLWLARALVAEAGWVAPTDHAAIAWVLARRWKRMKKRWPRLRFVTVIRSYCAGLGHHPAVTRRQMWVRSLPWGDPTGWLRRYAGRWQRVRDLVEAWARGEVLDPCSGSAWHWGGPVDTPRPWWRQVRCGNTSNRFYALR